MIQLFSRHLRRAALFLAAALGAAGFALGGGGATGTGYVAYGVLHAFGSIFVNDIEFFTDKAAITINGVPNRSQSDLRIGMVMQVQGTVDNNGKTGNATTVVYNADAIGAIESVGDTSLQVLGQAIGTDASTVFDGFIALSDLRVGDFVEVSGYRSPDGLLARRIARLGGSMPAVQVSGPIVSTSSGSFVLGTLTVDYSSATLKNVPSGGFAAGQNVVVKGPAPSAGLLVASEVEVVAQNLSGNSNGSTSGVIGGLPAGAVMVNGQVYVLTSGTQYVNGTAADLAIDKLVKVDFAIVSSTLVATRVEFTQLHESAQVEANVTAVGASSLEVLGPGGITITANAATQFRDSSSSKGNAAFSFAQARVGDHVVVRGNQVGDSTLLADRIERAKPSAAIMVEGRALSAESPSFSVMDTDIDVDAASDLRDETGTPIAADVFFAKVAGHDVTVTAVRRADGSLLATSVRLDY